MQRSLFARRTACFLSVSLLTAVLISPPSLAEILAYDTFDDYNSVSQFWNKLFLQNSGVGLRGYWQSLFPNSSLQRDDLYQIVSPGLGGDCKVHIVAPDNMNVAVRSLDQPIPEGKTVFVRVSIRPDSFPANRFSEFGLKLVFAKGEAFAGKGGYLSDFWIEGAGSTTKAVAGTTYLLVVKIELLPGNDRLSLYNVTTLSPTPPEPIAVSTRSDFGELRRLGFWTQNATVSYDSLVVADTFSDVIFPSITIPPKISWNHPTINEGNEGTNNVAMTFSLSAASSRPISFSYSTIRMDHIADSARANEDFLPLNGVITFPPGSTQQTLNLPIIGDSAAEPNESIPLMFKAPVNGAFYGTAANEDPYLTIKNDDLFVLEPNLTIQPQTNGFLLQWNAGSGGNLEYTDQFPPTNGWSAVPDYISGQTYSASVPFSPTNRFFRTRK